MRGGQIDRSKKGKKHFHFIHTTHVHVSYSIAVYCLRVLCIERVNGNVERERETKR